MKLSYDQAALDQPCAASKTRKALWIFGPGSMKAMLKVGDDIMNVCVAGRFRTDILPVFQEL